MVAESVEGGAGSPGPDPSLLASPEGRARRGKLRIYLGAAPGVGKTFAMLDEGWRRAQRGADVVVGYVETHGRARTEAQLRDLEVIPRRRIEHRGATFDEMDIDAVLARRPEVALVDELAHTNVEGSRHRIRVEDVEELLDAGIDVITTVNVQHLESLNDVVEQITGIVQQETVPDAAVRAADQIELVDMDPEALRRRLAHGNVYPPERVDAALGNYFRLGNLTALRELALLWVADRVDEALHRYRSAHGIGGAWETRERVVVAVTGSPSGAALIRRAARVATRSKADLLGVHVRAADGLVGQGGESIGNNRRLVEDLGGTYHEVVGADVAAGLASFAEAEGATQLVVGVSRRKRWQELLEGSVVNALARRAGSFDLHVIGTDGQARPEVLPRLRRRDQALSARRRMAGWLLAVSGVPLITFAMLPGRDDLELSGDLMVFLMLVVAASAIGGLGPGVVAAIGGSLALNWYFTDPLYTLTIAETENALALLGFLIVGGVISFLVTEGAHRTLAASRAAAEAEALARIAGGIAGSDDPVPPLLDRLRSTFGLSRVAVEIPGPSGWIVEALAVAPPAVSGARLRGREESPPAGPTSVDHVDLDDGARLVLEGGPLAADDRRVLHAFVAQLGAALERRRLQADASRAAVAADSDALRAALLRAVSHDLRTPLASIKASVSSLLQDDIAWPADAIAEFLETIDDETDRLDALVGNLLDMSRLDAGAVVVTPVAVGWDEVVAGALASLSEDTERVEVQVPESLPRVSADPVLLERAVANLIGNALRHAPPPATIRVEAGAVGGRVDLRVVDTGPGVPADRMRDLFRPFQRLGDHAPGGVGLGLAVAHGFVSAMGGTLEAEESPGGGLTMVVRMEAA